MIFVDKNGKEFQLGDYVIDQGLDKEGILMQVSIIEENYLRLTWNYDRGGLDHGYFSSRETSGKTEIITENEALLFVLKRGINAVIKLS